MIAASGTLSLWQVAHDQRGEGKGRLRTHNVLLGGSGAVATSIQSHFVTDLAGFRLFLSTASGQI